MRQFEGYSCLRMTEYILRYVLARMNGDMYIDTMTAVGTYWKAVLSPETKQVAVSWRGTELSIASDASFDLADVPVDVEFEDGARRTVLVNIPAGGRQVIDLSQS